VLNNSPLLSVIRVAREDTLRSRIARVYVGLVGFNLAVWAWSLLVFHAQPALLGAAVVAYTLGLRHAVDADHIAAIDNVTRKLMQAGKRPVGVGLSFSLGHSTVVLVAFICVGLAATALDGRFQQFKETAGLLGTGVSIVFLFAIALINTLVLLSVWRSFRRVKAGGRYVEADLDFLLAGRGLLARLFRPAFRLIGESWDMYPLGVLFGLGFDTATEIAILGMSAAGLAHGASLWSLLALPAMFTAGMTLVDTSDSVLMLGAYGWAFMKPIRKLYYNLTITLVSILIALLVGGIEALGVIGRRLGLDHGVWGAVAGYGNFGGLGYLITGIFVLSWAVAAIIYWLRGYDRIEVAGV
jgi:nickel/cobalt transporter (NiCoT) family protein